jgi:hypothetical protein
MQPTAKSPRFGSIAAASVLVLAVALAPARARAGDSTDIVRESVRTLEGGNGRVATFWWLPQEYWELAAKELALPPEEQEKVRTVFRDYLVVGALETKLNLEKKPEFASIVDIVARAKFFRNGQEITVLRDVNPELARLVPSLVYLLRASLGGLGEGLRLLPLANVDGKGNRILTGTEPGVLELDFRFDPDGKVQQVSWHAPFTSIVGARKCPKGGEPLEASFDYCPWHGVRVKPE